MTGEPPVELADGSWARPIGSHGRWVVTTDREGLDPCPIMIGQTLDDCRRDAERRALARGRRPAGSCEPGDAAVTPVGRAR